jgi:hypothetical protein
MTDKKCWDRNSHGASGTIFKISNFKEADRNVIFICLFVKEKASYKFENHFPLVQKVLI